MSIVIKKIGEKKYAYLAYRRGGKVVQKYLGSIASQRVSKKIEELKAERGIPERFRYLFWDTDPLSIDTSKNSTYIIERVLELGSLDSFHWIQRIYPTKKINETLEVSRKLSPKSKNFWGIWLRKPNA